MEQPSVTYSATQSVDYLGQTHKWTDTDVISSYKEICKQLDIVQEKLREEREQKGQRRLRKSSSHSKQLSQKAALQAQQSQRSHRGRNDNIATLGNIGNISKQLKQQKDESALRAEEKRLIRMKNALWRRMGPSVGCVGKGNKLVSPKTLKWGGIMIHSWKMMMTKPWLELHQILVVLLHLVYHHIPLLQQLNQL
ncbi:hypothetical protein RhiirA5_367066 [Rhizophagus irregularis]|uniref:Uncharacterized protein n=1 Tax=Rhizophagus irregularis TaxID=588596 RepID=A0A2I1GDP8_9GLOM|nr:hypothetical protein RhiirA5_367066 [Rhizophagus irregularis]PKY44748.1 hypothetical protein RhiirA4_400286 [Rhizophagus irregularis]